MTSSIHYRHEHSTNIIETIVNAVADIQALRSSSLCLYATGSFGRFEAGTHSDLDMFFIHPGTSLNNEFARIEKILVDAELIQICRQLGLPDFDGDGKFLGVHYLDDIIHSIGGPEDDHLNHFTARMLLLLESRWLCNESEYDKAIKCIITSYYRDYDNHETAFSPRFLVNDIMRFWKTMCLNYEHRRNRTDQNLARKNKNHLVNLKLKFSKLLTCFSTIAVLSTNLGVASPEELFELVHHSPLHRLQSSVKNNMPLYDDAKSHLDAALDLYSWFLDQTDRPKAEIIDWLSNKENRVFAFKQGRQFGDELFDLLTTISDRTVMRYLVE